VEGRWCSQVERDDPGQTMDDPGQDDPDDPDDPGQDDPGQTIRTIRDRTIRDRRNNSQPDSRAGVQVT
jgi:hypothetical protein